MPIGFNGRVSKKGRVPGMTDATEFVDCHRPSASLDCACPKGVTSAN